MKKLNQRFVVWPIVFVVLLSLGFCSDPTQRSREAFEKGFSLLYQSKYNEAIVRFDEAIKANAGNFEAWHYKGSAWANLRQTLKAMECYQKAIEINPKYAEPYFNMGLLYEQQNDRQSACTCFLKAEELGKANMNDYTKLCK